MPRHERPTYQYECVHSVFVVHITVDRFCRLLFTRMKEGFTHLKGGVKQLDGLKKSPLSCLTPSRVKRTRLILSVFKIMEFT